MRMTGRNLLAAVILGGAVTLAAQEPPPPADDPGATAVEYIVIGDLLKIRQAVIDDNEYNRQKYEPENDIRYVTIHNTAEPYDAFQERTRVNLRTTSVTSFHFCVDESEAVQILPDYTHGWHAGDGRKDGNMHSIGIEIARSQCIGPDNELYLRAEQNAAVLAAYLLKKYGLSVDDLRMHYDWIGKHCPHRILDAGSWDDFKAAVAEAMKTMPEPEKITVSMVLPDNEGFGGINISWNAKTGSPLYNTMYGKDFANAADMIEDLKANKVDSVTVSCWVMDYDAETLINQLAEAGIEVAAFYVPEKNVPDWVRKNLIVNTTEI